jgi:hypothetical protein
MCDPPRDPACTRRNSPIIVVPMLSAARRVPLVQPIHRAESAAFTGA